MPKFLGEVVEKLRMSRGFSQASKIIRRRDNAASENVMPYAVRQYAVGERVSRRHNCFGQIAAPAASRAGVERLCIDRLEKTAGHGLGRLFVITADEKRLILSESFENSGNAGWHGYFVLQASVLREQICRIWEVAAMIR